jgi:peptidoglycan/LPS O-acetylase OafA/YrhL
VVAAQSHFYGRAMAYPPVVYVHNALLLDTAIGDGYVDLVNWTLAIEVKFYVLVAILRPWILRGRATPLIGFALLAVAIGAAQARGTLPITGQLACIGFMLIGTLFHYRMTGSMGTVRAIATGVVLTGLFLAAWRAGPFRDQFPVLTVNYLYGLAIFWLGYLLRRRLRPLRWLDFLAAVSFPLYLVHSIVGYSLMTFMIRVIGLTYGLALPIAFALTMLLAWMLHRAVERPSLAAGKRLARNLLRARNKVAVEP